MMTNRFDELKARHAATIQRMLAAVNNWEPPNNITLLVVHGSPDWWREQRQELHYALEKIAESGME